MSATRIFNVAAPLIERLLSGEVQASESDLVIARRMKAVILARPQGYPKLKEAIELIDRNLASPLADPQDKRLKVRFLLADPRRARGPEVLELAESLVMTGGAEPDPDDRFQLARLYLARGNWERCREQMEKLVNSSQTQSAAIWRPTSACSWIGTNWTTPSRWLDRLDRVSDPGPTVALRAEWLYRKKEWGKVPDFLAVYVSQGKAEPKGRPERILLAAQLLERLAAGRPRRRGTWPETTSKKPASGTTSYVRQAPRRRNAPRRLSCPPRRDRGGPPGRSSATAKNRRPEEVFEVVGAIVSRPETKPAQLKALRRLDRCPDRQDAPAHAPAGGPGGNSIGPGPAPGCGKDLSRDPSQRSPRRYGLQ